MTRTSTTGPTAGQVTTYHWNRRSQLTGIDLPPAAGGATVSYRYDALGRRIKKDVDGAVTGYVYDGDDIALETDAAGSVLRRYRHGDGIDEPLVLEEASGESFFYHRDHLGSVVMVTDEAGLVAAEYEYDAYGRRDAISEDVEQPYAFTGREWDDESGLYYYRARYYDPTTGRFLSEDPIGFGGVDANLYRYVKGNPMNFVDPSGLETGDWWDFPANIDRAREIGLEELKRRPLAHNDIEDAMRHAEWMRRTTQETNACTAWLAGTAHEIEGLLGNPPQPLQELFMDLHNNAAGRDAGSDGDQVDPGELWTLPLNDAPYTPYHPWTIPGSGLPYTPYSIHGM